MEEKKIWTIGHSTKTIEEFIQLLQMNDINTLIDVRQYPGSKREPQFNKAELKISLENVGIAYIHMVDLGGRRKAKPNSLNTAWRSEAFRGYADYMETEKFKTALQELVKVAAMNKTAFMCSEAVWWKCHRSLISDDLKVKGWKVLHILSKTKVEEHPFTKPAKVIAGKLSYVSDILDIKF